LQLALMPPLTMTSLENPSRHVGTEALV